jgi:hypothetical protein
MTADGGLSAHVVTVLACEWVDRMVGDFAAAERFWPLLG